MKLFLSRRVMGVAIVIFGVLMLLDNFDIYEIDMSLVFGLIIPFVLLGWGIEMISRKGDIGAKIFGVVITVIAINMLSRKLDWFYVEMNMIWGILWPALLIFIGYKMIFQIRSRGKIAFLGGIEQKTEGWQLEDGSYMAIMGGVELDITKAKIVEGKTVLYLTAIMGGIDVLVPNDVNIICRGTAIIGGIDFFEKSGGGIFASVKEEHKGNYSKTIEIRAEAIVGGVDVKLIKAH
ncbi:MAG: LiaF domain-containing protein [Alkaliphilus sp.]